MAAAATLRKRTAVAASPYLLPYVCKEDELELTSQVSEISIEVLFVAAMSLLSWILEATEDVNEAMVCSVIRPRVHTGMLKSFSVPSELVAGGYTLRELELQGMIPIASLMQ